MHTSSITINLNKYKLKQYNTRFEKKNLKNKFIFKNKIDIYL